ncbi:MAG: creatininase family protein [Rhodospirillales bacterium]|nr:creatininase family protein [Rhodospirillales bacterium]
MTKHLLAQLTSAEARERLAARPVILLPLGSHEDQGPHAPMGDFLSAAAMAERIAARAGERGTDALVAPVVPFGVAEYFGHAPGGIALSPATFRALFSEVLEALLRHGQTRLLIINGHGGNVPVIHEVTLAIRRARGLIIPSFYLWRIGYGLLPGILGPEKARAASGHGADPLTSVAMHLFPALMRLDLVPAPAEPPPIMGLAVSGLGTARFEGAEIQIPIEFNEAAPGGALNADARLSAAATGALLVEQLTELGARFVLHYAQEAA